MSETIIVNPFDSMTIISSMSFFSEVICKQLFVFYDMYVEVCTENSSKDGTAMVVCCSKEENDNPLGRLFFFKDPFGDHRGQFEYSSILSRLQKLKNKLEDTQATKKPEPIDTYTQKIIDAAELNSNLSSNNNTNLDDIFDDDEDDDDDDDDENI